MRYKIPLLFLMVFTISNLIGQDALSIVKKLDVNLSKIKDRSVDIEMTMVNLKTNKSKIKRAQLLQKGDDKKLFRYTYPESDAGISTLSLPNNEIYLYLPMFKKPKKITNMAESNAFNKSDFSISEMANSSFATKYDVKLLGEEGNLYIVNLSPKDEKSAYKKLVMHINKTTYNRERTEYYNNKGLVKFATYKNTKVDGLWIANEVTMEDVTKKHKTMLKMSNIKLNQGLKDELFTLENLVPAESAN